MFDLSLLTIFHKSIMFFLLKASDLLREEKKNCKAYWDKMASLFTKLVTTADCILCKWLHPTYSIQYAPLMWL